MCSINSLNTDRKPSEKSSQTLELAEPFAQILDTLKRQILEQTQKLQESETDLHQLLLLLAMVSHDLLNALNCLSGFTRLSLQLSRDDKQKHYLNLVKNQVQTVFRLSQDIQDLAQIEHQGLRFSQQPHSVNQILLKILSIFQSQQEFPTAGPNIHSDLTTELYWELDPGRFQQIIHNLLGNAVKHAPQGDIWLRTVRQEEREWIEVSDTGPGISNPDQERIFEPFYQGENNPSRAGFGLGLSIAQILCTKMKLKLSLKSTLN